jgi:formiminotetrahydrofolate cyclodeaminase
VAKNVKRIAKKLGAKVIERLPDVGGGAVGAMRMAKLLQARMQPGQGERPGRPSVPTWTRRPKVPMSEATEQRLAKLAEVFSREQKHRVTPMQVAAQLLEAAVENYATNANAER